jgi:outer membrane protein assembly factor BamB
MAIAKAFDKGFVVSGQQKSVIIDSATGKQENLPKVLMAGITDGTFVFGGNGQAWKLADKTKVWKEPVKIGQNDGFAVVSGHLILISEKSVSSIDQTSGKPIWTLELSAGTVGSWATTSSYLFVEALGWVFRILPEDGSYVFLAKYGQVKELYATDSRLAVLADNKMVIFDQYFSSPLLTMGQSNKTIDQLWISGDNMLILSEAGYHFGTIPTDMTKETKQNFKVFTYNVSKDKKMMAFSQVLNTDSGNFAIVQGNLVACIGPNEKKDIWYIELPPQDKDDFLPHILSIDEKGVLVFYKGKASLWH